MACFSGRSGRDGRVGRGPRAPRLGTGRGVIAGGCRARLSLHARHPGRLGHGSGPPRACGASCDGRFHTAERTHASVSRPGSTPCSGVAWGHDDDACPYGSWPSPLIRGGRVRGVAAHRRRALRRRRAVVGRERAGGGRAHRRPPAHGLDGEVVDVLPAPWNARSRVHEYGGGAWTSTDDGTLCFVEKADQRVWALEPGEEPRGRSRPPTDGDAVRRAHLAGRAAARDPRDARRRRPCRTATSSRIAARRRALERDHRHWSTTATSSRSPRSRPTAITSPGSRGITPTCRGTAPSCASDDSRTGSSRSGRPSPAGTAVALQPRVDRRRRPRSTPTTRPVAGTSGALRLTADLHHEPIAPADADTGGPLWVLGTRWFALLDDGRIVAVRTNGDDEVVVIDADGAATPARAADATADVVIEDVRGTRVLARAAPAPQPRRRCGSSTSTTRPPRSASPAALAVG